MTRPLVAIPTYNEVDSIRPLIQALLALPTNLEILVIDDNSPDGTAEAVRALSSPRVHVLERAGKQGLGSAYRAAFAWAADRGKFTHYVTIDGDGSHRPEDLVPMLAEAEKGIDVVLSSRWMPGGGIRNWPKYRQFLSRAGTSYARSALKLPFSDLTGGFRVYAAALINRIRLNAIVSDGYCFQVEMVRAANALDATISEVPIVFVERVAGRSKMSRAIVLEALRKVTLWGLDTRLRPNADKLHYVK